MLTISALEAGYGKTKILDGLSFQVETGAIVALLGGNGTGKSTALKTIAGLLAPSGGSIDFDGRRIDGLSAHLIVRRGLALVPQGKDVFPLLSVEENLKIGGFVRRTDPRGLLADLGRMYETFSILASRRRQTAGTLSGGEQQMPAIARALMSRPSFLMLDEPSAALAPKAVEAVANVIRDIHGQGLTILLVEQNVGMALALARYVYVLRDGRIALEEHAERLRDPAILKAYYLG